MASRFEQLKGALGTLASPPEVQIEHLRNLFVDEEIGEQFHG